MRISRILLTTSLIILFFLISGCTSEETPKATNLPDQGATLPPDSITLVPTNTSSSSRSPTETSMPRQQSNSAVFLPTLLNKTHYNPYSGINQDLPPEKWQEWPVIPAIGQHAIEIYQAGIAQGNDARHFSKVGDCQNIHQYFLGTFDDPTTFQLGEQYTYLEDTIDYYSGSWVRASEAVRTGFNVASVLAPLQADPQACQPAESPLACEIRIWNPSFVIISMETWTNDRPVEAYDGYLRQIVDYAISKNVLPIVATKADNLEGDHAINQIVANVAADYDIPMWNFWAATHPLTDEGLLEDGFHLTNGPNNFGSPESLDLGWPVRNLTGLLLVDAVWRTIK